LKPKLPHHNTRGDNMKMLLLFLLMTAIWATARADASAVPAAQRRH
jgi:hypothetical protein